MAFLSGQLGKVTADSQDLNVTNWSFEPSSDNLETTHTGSAGYKTYVPGTKGATGQVACNFDTSAIPFADPPDLNVGKEIAISLWIGDPAANRKITIGAAVITNTPIVSEVNGLVSFTFSFTVNGSWTMPTS